jgi:hypothetical protein
MIGISQYSYALYNQSRGPEKIPPVSPVAPVFPKNRPDSLPLPEAGTDFGPAFVRHASLPEESLPLYGPDGRSGKPRLQGVHR